MVLTTPLIARLAEAGPVHVVATPANATILANNPAVASVIVFDKRGGDRGWRGVRRVAAELRATGAEAAYMAQGSLRTAMLARMAAIPQRVGFASSAGHWLYTRQVPYQQTLHHAERLWQLASVADAAVITLPAIVRPSLYPGSTEHQAVDALLAEYGVQPHERLVALAPGSVWATKRWPGYDALAANLAGLAAFGAARIVVIGGADDKPLAQAITAAVAAANSAAVAVDSEADRLQHTTVVDATGRLSLLASAALLSRAALLISNDSAPLHLASAMNTPTVALFGPTVPALGFGPLAERREILEVAGMACRPCGAHGPQQCPLGHWRCMRDLTVDAVVHAVTPTLQNR